VVLTQAETDSPDRLVNVEIRPPSGDEPQYLEFELPEAAAGGEIGFAFFRIEVVLPPMPLGDRGDWRRRSGVASADG